MSLSCVWYFSLLYFVCPRTLLSIVYSIYFRFHVLHPTLPRKCVNNQLGNKLNTFSNTENSYHYFAMKILHDYHFHIILMRTMNFSVFHMVFSILCVISCDAYPFSVVNFPLTHTRYRILPILPFPSDEEFRRQLLYFVRVLESSTRKIMLPSADNKNNIYFAWNVSTRLKLDESAPVTGWEDFHFFYY